MTRRRRAWNNGLTMSETHAARELWCIRKGLVPYAEALALQKQLEAARQAGRVPDVLLLLEHPPVYTRGRRSDAGRAADGRGLVPRPGHRGRRHRPRRPRHLPRARPARRLSDHEPAPYRDDVHDYIRRMERAIIAALGRVRHRGRPDRGADRRLDARAAQDRARSASTSAAASRPTASRSTSTTTSSRSSGSFPAASTTAGCPRSRASSARAVRHGRVHGHRRARVRASPTAAAVDGAPGRRRSLRRRAEARMSEPRRT